MPFYRGWSLLNEVLLVSLSFSFFTLSFWTNVQKKPGLVTLPAPRMGKSPPPRAGVLNEEAEDDAVNPVALPWTLEDPEVVTVPRPLAEPDLDSPGRFSD